MNKHIIPRETQYQPDEPQPLVRKIDPCEAFPIEALEPLSKAILAVQGMTQAPLAIPAASALAVASLAVQGFADVETLGGSRPLSLYVLTIAKSGERKSACDAPFMDAVLTHEREQTSAQHEAKSGCENKRAIWKTRRDAILNDLKRAKGDKRTELETDLDALGPEPVSPPAPDRTVSEPTFEGLTKLFAVGQPSLGLFSDEGGQFLGGHAMNGENRQKTLAAFNDLWQGHPIRRTRAGDGHATLYGRRLAVHLMVQPTIARRFMADPLAADTGFLPRFLISEPPTSIGTRLHANSRKDDVALRHFVERLSSILNRPMPTDEASGELRPRTLPLTSEARDLLIRFSDKIELEQAPERSLEHVTGYASKAAEQAARIAGVLTLWCDLEAPAIGKQYIENGINLAQFYLSEAARLTSAAMVSNEISNAEKLQHWLLYRFKETEVTVRDVTQSGPNSIRDTAKARAALEVLDDHGWIIKLPPGTIVRGAARKVSWRIVKPTSRSSSLR